MPAEANDQVRYIPLTGGGLAIVDASDYEALSKHRWRALGGESGYAYRVTGGRYIFMHRLIMNAPPGKVVDHFNGNRQDNRRVNLRLCTQAQNVRCRRKFHGTSRFKGVSWNKRIRKWVASIFCDGKYTFLGHFADEVKAAKAYDKAARRLFGEYARLNFPDVGNIVYLQGRICIHSHAKGRLTVAATSHRQTRVCRSHPILKFEIRISKFETNPNGRNSNHLNVPAGRRSLCISDLGHVVLFRASDFTIRISVPPVSRGPPGTGNCALKAVA